jgi:hypothetical protein
MGSSFSRALGKRQDLNSHVCHKRIRHYGLLSSAPRRKLALAAARAALDVPPPQAAVIESVAEFMQRLAHIEHTRCRFLSSETIGWLCRSSAGFAGYRCACDTKSLVRSCSNLQMKGTTDVTR